LAHLVTRELGMSGRRRKRKRDCKGQGTAELDYRFHDVSFGLEDDDAFARIGQRGSAARGDLDPVGDGFDFVAPVERSSRP
jgi:hypothetical protein